MTEQTGTIQREGEESRQPRFSPGDAALVWRFLLDRWTKDSIQQIPAYNPDSRVLDRWLSDFWRTETLLSGVMSSVVSIDKNRGWSLTGGRNQVGRFQRVLRNVENGAGWRRFASMQSESFWSTNIGAIAEIGRIGDNGPLGALYHVDPTRCCLTGDVNYPLEYDPARGDAQQWGPLDFMRATSMPMVQEEYNQLGYCAVMRAVQFTVLMVAIYRHDREMLFSLMPKGLLLMSGIDEQDWEDAMQTNAERLTAREREFYAGLSIFFSGMGGDIDAKLVSLSQLPHGFSMGEWTTLLMNGYALVFGYDAREFWPVSGGSLGTGRETEVQALKATGKGGLDFALAFQDNLQCELPPTLLFEFEQRDDMGQAAEYAAIQAYATAVNEMARPSATGYEETLTAEQRRVLYAERGFIPEEWTYSEEDVTATDVEGVERDRMLSRDQVLRACQQFPNEPIVRLTWDWKSGYRVKRLWDTGEQALEAPAYCSLPPRRRRESLDPDTVLYEGDDFAITGADVERAIQKWNKRVPDAAGLLEAASPETVEED